MRASPAAPTRRTLRFLEEPYRSRAAPAGTLRYWSWLFAARDMREALIGVYALTSEWRALTDVGVDVGVAQVKLGWWREELQRSAAGAPLHPITRYLAQFPSAQGDLLARFNVCLEAVAVQVMGVPLERATELETHADALYGVPLRIAARIAGAHVAEDALYRCTGALAAADYLARAATDYPRDARIGRIPFAIDELLAAGIDNDDLKGAPSPRLTAYLDRLRARAVNYCATALEALPAEDQAQLRHLRVLATLMQRQVNDRRSPTSADFRLADLYNAWKAARRATAAR